MKGGEQPTSEKNHKSPHNGLAETVTAQKSHKIYKILEMYSSIETKSNNVRVHRRETRSEDKETSMAPGTSARTTEPTLDLLPSPIEG